MELIKTYKSAARILMKGRDDEFLKLENLREIAEHKDEIADLVKGKHLYEFEGGAYVSQRFYGLIWAWDLRDFYLGCDTPPEVMTSEELREFFDLGGAARS